MTAYLQIAFNGVTAERDMRGALLLTLQCPGGAAHITGQIAQRFRMRVKKLYHEVYYRLKNDVFTLKVLKSPFFLYSRMEIGP
jgi:hypothetical protein